MKLYYTIDVFTVTIITVYYCIYGYTVTAMWVKSYICPDYKRIDCMFITLP